LNADGAPRYTVQIDGNGVLRESRLGLVRDDVDFSRGLRLNSGSDIKSVEEHYEIVTAKRRANHYQAREKTFHLDAVSGQKMDVIFRVSNNGLAFRYCFPGPSGEFNKIEEEVSSFHFLHEPRSE
jgi:alpha-glucosidase